MGKSTFMPGPAMTMTMRFHSFWDSNVRCRSSGKMASRLLPSSSIFTNPPNGRTPMQYSVSRPRIFTSFGPKPTEKVSTFTPKIFANAKCPASWMKMSTLTKRTK